ncbi:MAG TPA: universal stress protein [Acidobacteriota bacterium]
MASNQIAVFRRILIPLDFTDKNSAAVRVAKKMARQNRSEITLLHVIEQIEGLSETELSGFYETLESKAEKQMRTWSGKLDNVGRVKQVILFGNRLREIVNFAEAQKIDLIVLSSHTIDPKRAVYAWSTLSNRIAILAQCPVLLVK